MSQYIQQGLNFKIFVFILQIKYYYTIDSEYYFGEDHINESTLIITEKQDARKKMVNNNLSIPNISNKLYFNESNLEQDDIVLSYKVPKHIELQYNTTSAVKDKYSNIVHNKIASEPVRTTTKHLFDLKTFQEYDYKNEQDDVYQVLRYKASSEVSTEEKGNSIYNNTPYGKFYNLEPAVDLDKNINIINKKITDENVWYVPHEFPCWELPFLYGELGTKKKKANVFLIYGGNLINVIDPGTSVKSTYKEIEPKMSHIINKWCEVEPCYGDHTLCLFPNKRISKICDKEYFVMVPSMMDQLTIVNTINSMRNRVANGQAQRYSQLPTAANMKQIIYDYDLEKMSEAWLRQCLPGAAPCSALEGNIVSQLECTKYMKYCCLQKTKTLSRCIPKPECFIYSVLGCLHIWFTSAGTNLITTDIHCGRATVRTYNTIQLLWAKTSKIGCAYGERSNGDIRVVCNFSPGAPFYLDTKLFCGLIAHNDIDYLRNNVNLTEPKLLSSLGIKWNQALKKVHKNISVNYVLNESNKSLHTTRSKPIWGVNSLTKLYKEGWLRRQIGYSKNGTRGLVARLVARYKFIDETESRCDSDESVYYVGTPGSMCVEKSRVYHALCYDFRDPTPGYRVITIAASILLFSLILYDLFSGVVRQTIY